MTAKQSNVGYAAGTSIKVESDTPELSSIPQD